MDTHAIAERRPRVAGHRFVQFAVVPDLHPITHDNVRVQVHARSNACAGADDNVRSYRDLIADRCSSADDRRGMDAGRMQRMRIQAGKQ